MCFAETLPQLIEMDAAAIPSILPFHVPAVPKEMIKKVMGAEPSDYEVQAMMRSADADDNGTVDFDEFCEIYRKVKTGKLECAAFAQAMADFDSLLDSLDDDDG